MSKETKAAPALAGAVVVEQRPVGTIFGAIISRVGECSFRGTAVRLTHYGRIERVYGLTIKVKACQETPVRTPGYGLVTVDPRLLHLHPGT